MKILNLSEFEKEDKEQYDNYKDMLQEYKINKVYYIKDKYDIIGYDYIETEYTKINVSKSLILTLPFGKYFAFVLTHKSRSNVNEPYYFYKIRTLFELSIEYLKEKGEIVFENHGDEEDNYVKQENKIKYEMSEIEKYESEKESKRIIEKFGLKGDEE